MRDPADPPDYKTLLAGLGLDALAPGTGFVQVDGGFLHVLISEFAATLPFDEAFYLHANPDVAAAVARGDVADGRAHFLRDGYREGRRFCPAARPPEESRWFHATRRSRAEWVHRTIEGALVLAYQPPLLGSKGRGFRGGLVLTDAPEDIPLRHRRGGEAIDSFPLDAGPVGALPGAYVYAGPSCDAFGHAMAETLHRILPARALFDCRRLLFAGTAGGPAIAGFASLPPVLRQALYVLDVDPADVTVIQAHHAVERLHVAEQGSDLGAGPSEPYLRLLAGFTPPRLDALYDGAAMPPRLYVSRSRLRHGGLILGEAYFESQLAAEGWTVLHPQDLPLADQFQHYHRAETVIFAEGSACHGVELFGAGQMAHCLLLPRRSSSRHVFRNTLAPRARRFDVLPEAMLGGSAVLDDAGAVAYHLGVSVLRLTPLAAALRELGLARLPHLDAEAYRAAAMADFDAHLAHIAQTGARMVAADEIARIRWRCASLLE